MQHDHTISESDQSKSYQIKEEIQNMSPALQFCSLIQQDEKIQKELDLLLYHHFQRMLPQQKYHYNNQSQYYHKPPSKQQLVTQTLNYLNLFTQHITPFSPQHNKQLIFLLKYLNNSDNIITNFYLIRSNLKDSPTPAKFRLNCYFLKQRIDLAEKFLRFDNWQHLVSLSFGLCGWLVDDDWRAIVGHADSFGNLRELNLSFNRITEIKPGDIDKFRSLEKIFLGNNPLSEQSRSMLRKLQQQKKQMKIYL